MSGPNERPKVDVTSSEANGAHHSDITISRGGSARTYHGVGSGRNEAVKESVEKILNDPITAEWLPPSKKG